MAPRADCRLTPSVGGVVRIDTDHPWPVTASSSDELRRHLIEATSQPSSATVSEGTQRSHPDLELAGDAFGGGTRAVDTTRAFRSKPPRLGPPKALNNRIALSTGNTDVQRP